MNNHSYATRWQITNFTEHSTFPSPGLPAHHFQHFFVLGRGGSRANLKEGQLIVGASSLQQKYQKSVLQKGATFPKGGARPVST